MPATKERDAHSVAITGLSCRFPGDGDNVENFWESICRGKSAWSEIPKERFNIDAFHSASNNINTSITRGAHFIKQDITKFDANFFSLSKAEADSMDPQHRMMIEVTYEALEKAGLPLQEIAGTRTGVFMGHFTSDYREMIFKDPESAPTYTASGTSKTSLANRISWLFDLQGPSFTLDTACSSSLVALHLACQSLRTGESDIAIVAGVNLLLNPEMFMYFSNQHFLSPDGKCKSFDESGNGYGRGEGFAAVVLKRADDAIAGGDPLRAIIRGSGSNQDGHTKGFTLPSAEAQANLIEDTYRCAGLGFKHTSYVEAHGTGTQAGDIQETEALSRTISKEHAPSNKLLVGSVKSNIGHLEACAGLAGVIKAILILEYGVIPPTIHYRKGNPKIKFDEWNLEVPITMTPWPVTGLRRISVNSFGYGGTNAHAILDDAYHYLKGRGMRGHHYTDISGHALQTLHSPTHVSSHGLHSPTSTRFSDVLSNGLTNGFTNGTSHALHNGYANGASNGDVKAGGSGHHERPRLYVLSTQDKEGLNRMKLPLASFLETKSGNQIQDDNSDLANLAYTFSRKTHLQWRTFHIATSLEQFTASLKDEEGSAGVHRATRQPRIGFIFTGQGAQWPRMGMELMSYPSFRESVDAADEYLRRECGCRWSAKEELNKGKAKSQLHLAVYSQTLCTVLQVALVDLINSWKIAPVAVAGHSSGEIGAAYCLGALSREDAWKIAYNRGVLSTAMKSIAPEIDGSMMALGASPEQATEWIAQVKKGEVVVACVNSPSSVTLSGDTAAIDELLGMVKAAGVFARKLNVDTAYHSPHMQIVAQDYFEAIASIKPKSQPVSRRMHSSVIGGLIDSTELGPANWVRNLISPVEFAAAVYDMMRPLLKGGRSEENAVDVLIEIGPHSALQGPATQTLKAYGITNIPYQSVIVRDRDAVQTALDLAGFVYARGGKVDIPAVNNDNVLRQSGKLRPLINLPLYPWSHSQSYWEESRIAKEFRSRKQPRLSLLGAPNPTLAQGEHIWRKFIRLSEEPWIADHRIQTSIVYPGAGLLAMAFEAAYQIADPNQKIASFRLRDIQLMAAAVIADDFDLECIVHLRPHLTGTRENASTWTEFTVTTSPDGLTLQRNCSGLLIIEYETTQDSSMGREKDYESKMLQDKYLQAAQMCKRHIVPAEFYRGLTTIGLAYGPTFTNLAEIRTADGKSFCAVDIPDTPMKIIEGLQTRPHIIHPGTLDAIFHLAFAALNGAEQHLGQPMVPKAIDEIVVSAKIPFQPKERLSGFSDASKHGFKEFKADIMMFAEEEARPVVEIVGFNCMGIGGSSSVSDDTFGSKKICSKLTWKPAVTLLTSEEKQQVVSKERGNYDQDSHLEKNNGKSHLETQGAKSVLSQLAVYLRLLHHSKPDLSILEVGTTSGGTAPSILLPEMRGLESMLATADYTISSRTGDAMMDMQEHLSAFDDAVKYAVFDISKAPETQELNNRKFDVVIAFNLAETVEHPGEALGNARKLLKQGGELCLIEMVDPEGYRSLIGRPTNASGLHTLEPLLSRNGFKDRVLFHDFEDPDLQQFSLLTASTELSVATSTRDSEVITIERPNPSKASQVLSQQLSTISDTRSFIWGSDVSALKGRACISLLEIEQPLLQSLSESDFKHLKQLITEAANVLWVSSLDGPSAAMISGLARVVRNEIPGISFRTVHIDQASLACPETCGPLLGRIFASETSDDEFRIEDGIISVSRVEEDARMNEQIEGLLPNAADRIDKMPLGKARGPQKLCVQTPGMLDSLCFEPDNLPDTELEADCIEIDVKATALNFREIMCVMGQVPDTLLGFDAAGTVRRVGSEVGKFKIGDNVAMYGHGSHRTVHRSKADYCALIPKSLSFEQAATIPVVHGTAWYGLVQLARVRNGQSILIHAAAGGVGQAAIQIAQYYGMEIFATVGSEVKRQLLRETYNIPDDHMFNSRDLSFVKGVRRMTAGRGVDVILNSLSGEALRQTWYCIASFGTFLEIGIKDILGNTELDMRPFLQDAVFAFFNLNHIEKARPDIMASIIEGAFDFQRRGITRPITPLKTYSISEVENAFRLMQTGKHLGKLALTLSDKDIVPVLNSGLETLQLDQNAVYILVGGFGGLGRSISSMLVDHGARKLCFLSRSGGKSEEAQRLIHDLRIRQVQVDAYPCDVADEVATSKAVARCLLECGPVRGVIQCAMLLRDVLFTNMSYQQWVESTRPKVQGTWNLHCALKGLDFFVVLSSFAATFGNRGQSNYAAGGAYQDAISYYRRSQGLPAVTLDLGLMRDVGVLAEKGITESLREWEVPYGVTEVELHALLKRAISGDISGNIAPQILTGLATGGSAMAANISTPFYLSDARFSIMAKTGVRAQSANQNQGATVSTQTLVAQAGSISEAAEHIAEALVARVSKMLQTPVSEIDPGRFLHSYGIDSLAAIEIVNWALKELKASLTVIDVMAGVPITTTARKIATRSALYQGSPA